VIMTWGNMDFLVDSPGLAITERTRCAERVCNPSQPTPRADGSGYYSQSEHASGPATLQDAPQG